MEMMNATMSDPAPSFGEVVAQATGTDQQPYPYQQRLADEGPAELLRIPTGAGKTLAVTLPWLYRRRFHPDGDVRRATPHWLVLVLPMRVLVEQTYDTVKGWLKRLGLTDAVGLHLLMGGEPLDSGWRLQPEQDGVFVGTLDMLISRALNRGYGQTRWAWPIDFGLFNNGCHFVFDEVQLMGPALPTSRQLQGLRTAIGAAVPCLSTWMSATVEADQLRTVDLPAISNTVELGGADRAGPLAKRLEAAKRISHLEIDAKHYTADLAAALLDHHRAGTRTIAVLNTVDRATELHSALTKSTDIEVVLVHSRFRPGDRAERVAAAVSDVSTNGPGRIVVSTQVLEAGVDISSATLFTEAAPWPSVVQRAGRCNRAGDDGDAVLLWCEPPKSLPYETADLAAAEEALAELEGVSVTAPMLGARAVAVSRAVHPVLRRRDLVELFDTTADLSGNDIDVARFIRGSDDLDLTVSWRDFPSSGPDKGDPLPGRDERCPVPVPSLRKELDRHDAWWFDHLDEEWVRCHGRDLRPGLVLVLRADQGGYDPLRGWSPRSDRPVAPVPSSSQLPLTEADTGTGADPVSFRGNWVSLVQHLADVEREVRTMTEALEPGGLSAGHLEAAAVACRLHDLGKVHPDFQEMWARSASGEVQEAAREAVPAPWAKSGGSARTWNGRRYFRHELASALALLGEGSVALDGVVEPDLAVYLVAAHHGRVRLGFRSLPDERPPRDDPDRRVALGVHDSESLPATAVPGGIVPASILDLSVMDMGANRDGRPSWAGRMLVLRDRADLGPFRLGFLEALVRLADWRASAAADQEVRT